MTNDQPITHATKHRKSHYRLHLWLAGVAILCFGGGGYILTLLYAPQLGGPISNQAISDVPAPQQAPQQKEDRLYIPKLGVDIAYKSGGTEVLGDNAWYRYPERGNPADGGNFILAAHRFEIGLTPGSTKRKSPFYHLDKLQAGDIIYIDYAGTRYSYQVADRFRVSPNDNDIESANAGTRLTLYSCTLKGEKDGREVIIATLL